MPIRSSNPFTTDLDEDNGTLQITMNTEPSGGSTVSETYHHPVFDRDDDEDISDLMEAAQDDPGMSQSDLEVRGSSVSDGIYVLRGCSRLWGGEYAARVRATEGGSTQELKISSEMCDELSEMRRNSEDNPKIYIKNSMIVGVSEDIDK